MDGGVIIKMYYWPLTNSSGLWAAHKTKKTQKQLKRAKASKPAGNSDCAVTNFTKQNRDQITNIKHNKCHQSDRGKTNPRC